MNQIQVVHNLKFHRTSELKSNISSLILQTLIEDGKMDAFKGADKAFYFEFSLKENLPSDPSPYKQWGQLHHTAIHLRFFWRKFNPTLINIGY